MSRIDWVHEPAILTDWYWDIREAVVMLRAGGPLLAETPEQMTEGAKRIYGELVTVRALLEGGA